MSRPVSRAARHARVAEHLARTAVHSQVQLADLLAADGIYVTQATLSRDLDELGAVKVRSGAGQLVYAIPGNGDAYGATDARDTRLARLCSELLVSADASANLVVLRTPPGAAQLLAAAIDHQGRADLLGCVAGDDTVLVITRDPVGGSSTARQFLELANHRIEATVSSRNP